MAKTYVDIVKYMIDARFEISGSVDKPDIIGAVFGQTEGLLGTDLDLRELQKNGKIGRIEIEHGTSNNKTFGKLFLPSSLGKIETCIIAAAIESVDRVGPFETTFKIEKIEDTRNEKRSKIINRAKELVRNLLINVIPDSREISELVESDVKSSTVTTYGPEKLPAGPDIAKSESVILVEGRADVITLLRSDVTNCIAVGGAAGSIPKTILELCATKEVTLFLDGDRGGDMILRNIMSVADVDYVARAPEGKEVEELTHKEIIKAMRSRVPIEQIATAMKQQAERVQERERYGQRPMHQQRARVETQKPPMMEAQRPPVAEPQKPSVLSPTEITENLREQGKEQRPIQVKEEPKPAPTQEIQNQPEENVDLDIRNIDEEAHRSSSIEKVQFGGAVQATPEPIDTKLVGALNELRNTLRARLYSSSGEMVSEVPIRELFQTLQDSKEVNAVVFDGVITQRLVELAYQNGIKNIYGVRASQLSRKYEDMVLYTTELGRL